MKHAAFLLLLALSAVAHADRHQAVTRKGLRLDVVLRAEAAAITPDVIDAWLGTAAQAVAQFFGRAPRKRPRVVVLPAAHHGDDPVVFGEADREGAGSVTLYVDVARATRRELVGEWVAVHELLHLGFPGCSGADAWLGEGLATFYEVVVRARSGLITEDDAMQQLADGFLRGRKRATGRSLVDESRDMGTTFAYVAAYWGGAAFVLRAEALNRRPGRTFSDGLLALFRANAPMMYWDANEALEAIDRLLHAKRETSFARLGAALAQARRIDPAELMSLLGVTLKKDGSITLQPNGPGAMLRRTLFGRR